MKGWCICCKLYSLSWRRNPPPPPPTSTQEITVTFQLNFAPRKNKDPSRHCKSWQGYSLKLNIPLILNVGILVTARRRQAGGSTILPSQPPALAMYHLGQAKLPSYLRLPISCISYVTDASFPTFHEEQRLRLVPAVSWWVHRRLAHCITCWRRGV